MAESDKNLRAYFDKLLEIQKAQENRPLGEGELKRIASDLGLSESDWQAVQTTFENHYIKGKAFLDHQNWDDAIQELRQAVMLKPSETSTLFDLARAYQGQWKESGNAKDKELAEKYARKCLDIQADHKGAVKMISDLKKRSSNQLASSLASKKAIVILLSILIFFVGFHGVLRIIINRVQESVKEEVVKPSSQESETTEESTTEAEPAIDNNYTLSYPDPPEVVLEDNERAVPVIFSKEGRGKNIILSTQSSVLQIFDGSYSYTINADVIPEGIEIDRLKFKIELMDENNKIIATTVEEAVEEYLPIVQSGDVVPFNWLLYKEGNAPNIKQAVVTAHVIESQPAPDSYKSGKKIDIAWGSGDKPDNYDLEIRERSSKYEMNTFGDKGVRHELVLAYKNTGRRYIKKLQVNIDWFGKNEAVLASKKQILVLTSEAKLLSKQVRVGFTIGQIPGESVDAVKGYKVTVIDIE